MVTNIIIEKNRAKNAQFMGERTFVSFYVWVEIYLKSKVPIYSALIENLRNIIIPIIGEGNRNVGNQDCYRCKMVPIK